VQNLQIREVYQRSWTSLGLCISPANNSGRLRTKCCLCAERVQLPLTSADGGWTPKSHKRLVEDKIIQNEFPQFCKKLINFLWKSELGKERGCKNETPFRGWDHFWFPAGLEIFQALPVSTHDSWWRELYSIVSFFAVWMSMRNS